MGTSIRDCAHQDARALPSPQYRSRGSLLVQIWELDTPDERVRKVAALFDFPHIDLVLNACAAGTGATFREHDEFLDTLLVQVRAKDSG